MRRAEETGRFLSPIESEGTGPTQPCSIALTLFVSNAQMARRTRRRLPLARPSLSKAAYITSASYVGTVREKVAQFDATVSVSLHGTNETVKFFDDDLAVQQFCRDEGDMPGCSAKGAV